MDKYYIEDHGNGGYAVYDNVGIFILGTYDYWEAVEFIRNN